jgi:hypothetical protein
LYGIKQTSYETFNNFSEKTMPHLPEHDGMAAPASVQKALKNFRENTLTLATFAALSYPNAHQLVSNILKTWIL